MLSLPLHCARAARQGKPVRLEPGADGRWAVGRWAVGDQPSPVRLGDSGIVPAGPALSAPPGKAITAARTAPTSPHRETP
ncbi:hypothetical protein [Streptomyces sp. NPDC047525]|uniref:hypothetical protein n=1 Tax=Streptomyces sp. NPDC047525 TaxID=3155264 RepID=UPI0033EA2A40